jgi:antitoxin component of RelBE/YafQ-DinJ toxin-antitoxin module
MSPRSNRNPEDIVVATTRLPNDLHYQAKVLAELQGMSLSTLIRVALQEYVDHTTTPEALDVLQAEEDARYAKTVAAFEAFKTTLGRMTVITPDSLES